MPIGIKKDADLPGLGEREDVPGGGSVSDAIPDMPPGSGMDSNAVDAPGGGLTADDRAQPTPSGDPTGDRATGVASGQKG